MKYRCYYKHAYISGMTIRFYFSKVYYCFGLGNGEFAVFQTLGETFSHGNLTEI